LLAVALVLARHANGLPLDCLVLTGLPPARRFGRHAAAG